MYKAGIEYILGLNIKENFLSINPCIPKDWKEYSIQYHFGGSIYNIKVLNPEGKNTGTSKFKLNGEEIKEKRIKLQNNNTVNEIEVVM